MITSSQLKNLSGLRFRLISNVIRKTWKDIRREEGYHDLLFPESKILLLALSAIALLVFTCPSAPAQEGIDVEYVSEEDLPLSATLVPDPHGVIPAPNNDLITLSIDENKINMTISGSDAGAASVEQTIATPAEGRHSATLTTLYPDHSTKDSKQLLFIVDTIPPEIVASTPQVQKIPSSNIPFFFQYLDTGSGVETTDNQGVKQARINGQAVHAAMTNHADGSGTVVINAEGQLDSTSELSLLLTLQDRAGNEKTITNHYSVEQPEKTWAHCETAGYLYSLSNTPLEIRTDHLSPVIIRPHRTYPLTIPFTTWIWRFGHPSERLSRLNENIWSQFSLDSTDGSIVVKKVEFDSQQNNKVIFNIATQDQELDFTTLSLTFPNGFQSNLSSENCPFDSESTQQDVDSFYSNNAVFTFGTIEIPVRIEQSTELRFQVEPLNKTLVASAETRPLPEIDLQASWFEVNGKKYWFDEEGFSTAPAIEGFNLYTVNIGHKTGKWQTTYSDTFRLINNDRNVLYSKEILVPFDPPEIENFIYNRESRSFSALIKDEGTPLKDLRIFLSTPMHGDIPFFFDKSTGKLTAPFQLTDDIATVSLSVTDNASQNTTAHCVVYGELDDTSEDPDQSAVTSTATEAPEQEINPSIGTPAVYYNNHLYKMLYGTSPAEQMQDHIDFINKSGRRSTVSNKFCSEPSETISAALLEGPLTSGLHKVSYCTQKTECVLGAFVNMKFYTEKGLRHLFAQINNNILASFGAANWEEAKEKWQEAIAKGEPGWNLSQPPEPYVLRVNKNYYTVTHPPECEVRFMDLLPPVIFNASYNFNTGKIEADIYDHGAPLENLKTRLKLESLEIEPGNPGYAEYQIVPENPSYIKLYGGGHDYLPETAFNPSSGHFSGTYEDQGLELFGLTIEARDAAQNLGSRTIGIFLPQNPPLVALRLIDRAESGKSLKLEGNAINAQFLGEAWDESRIDPDKTRVRVDDQPIPYYGRMPFDWQGRSVLEYQVAEGRLLDSTHGIYRLNFGVQVDEGPHTAQFRVTDHSGYSAEASLDFSLTFKPEIFNFKASPSSVQGYGGPLFTALILDKGKNLHPDGISFFIDNQIVAQEALYYDPDSGYFCVLGPLQLSHGRHFAVVKAVDTDGNSAFQQISFFAGQNTTILPDTSLDISIDTYNIWEISNQNNDGQANPGETIRLFLSLQNNTVIPAEQCQASLHAFDSRIGVETARVSYGELSPGVSTMPLRGFEMEISPEIFDTTIRDPFEADFRLHLSCDEHPPYEIPFKLPIFKPSVPADISSQVVVEPDRLPAVTDTSLITLSGKASSSHSYVEEVTVLVNGREVPVRNYDKHSERFEVALNLDPGPNTIEMRAVDESGANGFAIVFISCNSAIEVTLDRLPRTTDSSEIMISGKAESSASIISEITMQVNGIPVDLRWHKSAGTFRAEVSLTSGLNTIVVEAFDEAGAYGRAQTTIRFEAAISVKLDRLPPSTEAESLLVTGSASSTGSDITYMQVLSNGSSFPTSYNAASKRFSATIDLQDGGNAVRAEARDETGLMGSASAFVNKTSSFVSPVITITSIENGDYFLCDPIPVNGTFSPGSSSVDTILVRGPVGCSDPDISGETFTAECDSIASPEGNYPIEVEIRTVDGLIATDTVIIVTGPCW
ncbi:hypothetical protein [Desulfofustis glycolicus]|uniref:Ig-like domain (Group 3) n=1 Tax=Desulfofustis glycolicus DSM 9705 TaxID=1121409 RepID=A0A1M5Y0J1_9BACT|nr:hypothetical protein [Desulfofustis glycolicus]SHI05512.1 hypothetical protein SAMN02745124_03512 [Desulfofustis glycolicus DSM 9705]